MSKQQAIEKYKKISFSDFTFDFEKKSLSSQRGIQDLPPKPSEILFLLLKHPGELVTRDAIIESVWKDQVVDYDQNINFCVKQIRQVLGDDPRSPQFIETVPKKGYRFIGDFQREELTKRDFKPVYLIAGLLATGLLTVAAWQFDRAGSEHTAKPYYASSEAEQAVKRGVYLYDQGGQENMQRAQNLFEKAISLQPTLSEGHAGLALVKLYLAQDEASKKIVREHTDKSFELSTNSSLANLAKAKVSLYYDWDIVSARRFFTQAMTFDPLSIPVLHDLAVVAAIQGDYAYAEEIIEKALNIDPGRFQEHYHAGWFYQIAGKYDMALKQCVQSLEIEPKYYFSLLCAGRSALKLKLTQTARHYMQEYMALYGTPSETIDEVLRDVEAGDASKFNRWYIELLQSFNADPFQMALAYGEIGETENALKALRNAIEQKNIMIPTAWAFDELRKLHDNQQFVELMQVVKRGSS